MTVVPLSRRTLVWRQHVLVWQQQQDDNNDDKDKRASHAIPPLLPTTERLLRALREPPFAAHRVVVGDVVVDDVVVDDDSSNEAAETVAAAATATATPGDALREEAPKPTTPAAADGVLLLEEQGMPVQRTDANNNNNNNNEDEIKETRVTTEQVKEELAPAVDEKKEPANQKKNRRTAAEACVTPAWASSLERHGNLASLVHAALHDISSVRMRDRTKSSKQAGGQRDPHAARLVAIAAQRERLRQQQTQQQDSNVGKLENESNGTAAMVAQLHKVTLDDSEEEQDEEQDHDDHDEEEEDKDGHRSPREAWLLLVRALNSLVLLVPPLIRLLHHAQRSNKQLTIGGCQIVNRKRTRAAWLLGAHVFDTTTRRDVGVLCQSLARLLYVHGLEGYALTDDGAHVQPPPPVATLYAHFRPLLTCLAQGYQDELARAATTGSSSSSSPANSHTLPTTLLRPPPRWIQGHPLTGFVADHPDATAATAPPLVRLESWTTQLDQTLGLHESAPEAAAATLLRRAVRELEDRLTCLFRKRFQQVRLRVYGSNLSGLSIGQSSDVDISVEVKQASRLLEEFDSGQISAAAFDKRRKQLVYQVCRCLEGRRQEFFDMQPIPHARVPVIKGKWRLPPPKKEPQPHNSNLFAPAKLDFDLCFFNGIAFSNSSLLKEYTLVDARVKPLIRLVKRWAKDCAIGSAATGTWSSYAWTNMGIFYLQAVGLVPNLQCPDLMARLGVTKDANNPDHHIKNLDTFFLTWEQAKSACPPVAELESLSITALFYGFLRFYVSDFPSSILLVSIRRGPQGPHWPRCVFRKPKTVWSIEDPFETFDSHRPHDLNHADDRGIVRILHSFRETKAHLETILQSGLEEEAPKIPLSLWPETTATQAPGRARGGVAGGPTPTKKNKMRGKKQSYPKQGGVEPKTGEQNAGNVQPGKNPPAESGSNHPENESQNAKKGRRGGPSKESEHFTGDSPDPKDKHQCESRTGRHPHRGHGRGGRGRGGGRGGPKTAAGDQGKQS